MRLNEKIAIVTGGDTGIGEGIVHCFAAEGATVVVASRKAETAEARGKFKDSGNIHFIQADVTDTHSVNKMVEQAVQKLGRLDIFVNNAGYADGRGVEQQSEEDWDVLINTNLNGYARCVRAALPYLKASRGVLLNISSRVALVGQNRAFAYCATKGGIYGMTKNLAIDLAQYGIRVNAILPGWIATPNLLANWPKHQPDPENALNELIAKHPLGRLGTPEDCGKAAVYLCSDDAEFVTGTALDIDGGITLGY
jgi:NAD(P)-dependent dehydrogenase (short-subunit alcohol dehydrogenase family)